MLFDPAYEKLYGNSEIFAPRNGFRYVEIWNFTSQKEPAIFKGDLNESDIPVWLDEVEQTNSTKGKSFSSGLRVLLCPKAGGPLPTRRLPFSIESYDALVERWRLPQLFLRAVCQQLSIVTQFRLRGTGGDQDDQSYHGLIVRGDADWTWDYGLGIIHNEHSNLTHAVCVGLTYTEISLVMSYLESCQALAHSYLLLPFILLDLAIDESSSLLKVRLKLLNKIQSETGLDRFSSIPFGGPLQELDRTSLDLGGIMRRLTCLSDWSAAHRSFCRTQIRLLNLIAPLIQDEILVFSQIDGCELEERLEFLRETLVSSEQKLEYLKESLQVQVQTVYSLIGQKDNGLNFKAANASRQIADDSRKVAILTRRDSTDMRIIAVVTLVFLPGTFTATLFGSAFFNFDATDKSGVMSKWIWLYWVVTLGLTAIVLVSWFFFSHIQDYKMRSQFNLEKVQPEQHEQIESHALKRYQTSDESGYLTSWPEKSRTIFRKTL